jgi:hypothetical protein
MMTIFKVTYWDPCNGMGGTTKTKGYFLTEKMAQRYIAPLAVGWDHDAYRIHPIEVQTEAEPTVLDELREYL